MVQVFECGGERCPKGGEHIWDGPEKVWTNPCSWCEGAGKLPAEPLDSPTEVAWITAGEEDCPRCRGTGEGGGGSSATCSKCGLDAMSHTLMNDVDVEWPPTRLERVDSYVAVHVLHHGLSLCSMSKQHGVPGEWPEGNVWVGVEEKDQATCKACLGRLHRSEVKE